MCGSMVYIQSATAEIMRGKKERRKKKQDENIMSASATQGGHNNFISFHDGTAPKIKIGRWTYSGDSGLKLFKIILF